MIKKKKRLGEILIEMGYIDEGQLKTALEHKRENRVRVGKSMLMLDMITEDELVAALSLQFNLPVFEEDLDIVDEFLLGKFTSDFIRKGNFLPVRIVEDSMVVLIEDPLDVLLADELRSRFGYNLDFHLVGPYKIKKLITKFVESSESLLDDIEVEERDEASDEFSVELNSTSAPIINLVNSIFRESVSLAASDIHISINAKDMDVRYRIDGIMHEMRRLPKELNRSVVARLKMMADLDITEKRLPQDGSFRIALDGKSTDLRISTLPSVYGEKVVIRILEKNDSIMTLGGLGFSDMNLESFNRLIQNPVGILLVTGPTGSGKSSTLYAAINEINDVSKNIITIEDPVEFKLNGITQVSVNPRIGFTFADGLRSILRQDPDVILVGEIRDKETADIAIRASNTGHLVFSTLHTNSAVSSITRLIDMGVEDYMVSSNVIGVLNQRLVRKLCSHCKEEYVCEGSDKDKVFFGLGDDDVTLYRGMGCSNCNHSGYKGRMPLHELFIIDDEISRLIMNGMTVKEIEEFARERGYRTLKDDGLEKSLAGLTTLSEVRRFVT